MSKVTLDEVIEKFPLNSIVVMRGRDIGKVIGYRMANGTGEVKVLFKHFDDLSLGREGQFTIRSHSYSSAIRERIIY